MKMLWLVVPVVFLALWWMRRSANSQKSRKTS
jgi:lipopolysaccharide biosynthesis regulator YciM